MKPELLEPLLLDRALGELPPEVAALLDHYLAREPDAARRAAELGDTLLLARRAIATPATTPCRPLDVEPLRRTERALTSRVRRAELLRLAACLALGLGLGWLVRPALTRPAPVSTPALAIAAPTLRAPSPAPSFWSLSRLADQRTALASTRHHETRFDLKWCPASPSRLPEDKR